VLYDLKFSRKERADCNNQFYTATRARLPSNWTIGKNSDVEDINRMSEINIPRKSNSFTGNLG
jgi:hypothetical protein